MSFFNKIDNNVIVDIFKQLLDGSDREIFLSDNLQARTIQ